jgi:hypothetical protein
MHHTNIFRSAVIWMTAFILGTEPATRRYSVARLSHMFIRIPASDPHMGNTFVQPRKYEKEDGIRKSPRCSGRFSLRRTALATPIVVFALGLFSAPQDATAQSTDQVSGVVTDSTGAVLPGALVKITNTDHDTVRTTVSKDDGSYVFPNLAIGPYKLEVTKEGFQSLVQSGIVLQVATDPTINVTLQIGLVSQTISVKADAAMVEMQSNGVGQVIQPEQVVDLPLNNRQATQLIALAGASVNTSSAASAGGLTGTLDYPTAVSFSVAGSQRNATNYNLDGSSNMDYRTNVGSPLPFPDALQEFKVETSAVPAESGSRPGGVVSAITKSGANALHGDLFEFLRNGVMDADAYNFPGINGTLPKPTHDNLKRNQFGGVIGGPIKKDKLFFFYGVQETIERQQQLPTSRTVPTPAMLAGDFTAFLAPPCQSSQVYLNSTVAFRGVAQQLTTAPKSNVLLPAWLGTPSAQVAAKVAALFPTPTNPCGTVSNAGYQHDNEYEHVGRVDWQRTESDSLFARYFITNYTLLSTLAPGAVDILTSSGVGLEDRVQNLSLGDTHVISSQFISSLRVNFNRTATQRKGNSKIPNLCSLGMLANCPTPNIIQALYLEPGNQGWDYENAFGISENVGWQIRTHQLQFGFAGEHLQMNGNGTFQLNPLPTFSNGASSYTNNSVADFVTGNVDSFGQGNGQLSREGMNMPSLYIQDNWKATRTFQLNLGVRWDPYFPQHNKYGQASNFNLAAYNSNVFSSAFTNAPPGVTFPGDKGFNGKSDTLNHALDFSPRVGFVWDPRGKARETIRAGYGLYWDTSTLWNAMHVVLNPPWGNTQNFTPLPVNVSSSDATQGGGLANPYFGQPAGDVFPTPFMPPSNYPFYANGTFVFQDQKIKPTNSQQWNLSIQKQMGANWLLSATYIGSKTTHVWLGTSVNPDVVITPGMTAPGIIANNVAAGNLTSGSCTLLYQGQQYTFNPCNQTSTAKTATVGGVNNESARKALNLSNPAQGYKMNGGVLSAQSLGNGAYNGVLISVQHRLSQGFSINGNYTWSHCLDTGELGQDIAASFQNPANPKADWANCIFDRRSIFNLSLVAQSPHFESVWPQRIVGNWTASGIFTASTGPYANVTNGSDVSLIGLGGIPGTGGTGNDRPNTVGNPFVAGTVAANPTCVAPAKVKTSNHWFNPCAFELQPAATFGDTARNSLLGPGGWNFDTAIWRTFSLTERFKLDLRGEAFNVFNHAQFGLPGTILTTTSSLGLITITSTGVNNQRIMQVAAKITF